MRPTGNGRLQLALTTPAHAAAPLAPGADGGERFLLEGARTPSRMRLLPCPLSPLLPSTNIAVPGKGGEMQATQNEVRERVPAGGTPLLPLPFFFLSLSPPLCT